MPCTHVSHRDDFVFVGAGGSVAGHTTKRVELFDGKSLSGWVFISKDTSVTNGVIACQGKPNSYARTLQSYQNYKLHVEWRWPDGPGNSGVFLHVNAPCESIFNQCEPPSG